MEKIKKFTMWILLVALCVNTFLFFGNAEEADSGVNQTVDFVLVLDCSGSLKQTDPHYLCATACKMFLDMVPLENARIAIIAFGYDGAEQYVLNKRSIENSIDLKKVHLVYDLGNAAEMSNKDEVKKTVDKAVQSAGSKTPIGTATLSAIDLLESRGSTDGNACVILLTDGKITADQSYVNDEENAYTAASLAAEHKWPIYTIQLNDGGRYGDNSNETKLMKKLATVSGAGEDGFCSLTSFAEGNTDVSRAFLNIFNRFMFGGQGDVQINIADANGMVERSLSVPALTSETTVVISGNSVDKVELINPDGESREIKSNVSEQKLVAYVENNNYVCIKLICPNEGTWTVRAYGDPNASIAMYDCSMKDLDLVLNSSEPDPEKILNKNESVTFNAYFAYHGYELLTSNYYAQKQPSLVITNAVTNQKTEYPMEVSANGYALTLPMSKIGEGAFTASAHLVDDMFRNGSKWSNAVSLRTENLPVTMTDPSMPDMEGSINSTLEKVDLLEHISNPDGDPLEYKLECTSDRNIAFDCTIDSNGYLTIATGVNVGTFEMQLSVKDGDMTEYLAFSPFTITITERPFEFTEISDAELWVDSYSWQEKGSDNIVYNLEDYYYDPDGLAMEVESIDYGDGKEFFSVEQDGSVLRFAPLNKGSATVTIAVTDGYTSLSQSFEVCVVSGKAMFWSDNWIYFALAAAAIALIIIIIVVISKLTRVKGKWDIKISEGYDSLEVEGLDISSFLQIGRKKKFALQQLINDIMPFAIGDGGAIDQHIPDYFNGTIVEGATKIMLKGVFAGKGCKVLNVPLKQCATGSVTVTNNYVPVDKKSFKYNGGPLEFKFKIMDPTFGTEKELTIEMQLSQVI